jgi:2,3-dihydroxy-p-cumate/2,3-dihydroxybenzoate 3,4-dioxygenase
MAVENIRYKGLGYVSLNVTDLDRSRAFYEKIVGLEPVPSSSADRSYFRCTDRHHDVVLARADRPGLGRVAWEMESQAALDAARAHLAELGRPVVDVPAGESAELAIGQAFRTTEPGSGAVFEYFVGMEPGERPFKSSTTEFQQIGHVVIGTPDIDASEKFLLDEMNFRVSDRLTGLGSFMRAHPNPFHHSFGVGKAPRPGLNHLNFMVVDLDDVGRGFNRLRANNVPIVYGPGRHPQSGSVFLYFLDPDGLTLEYSFGMEEFSEHAPRPARDMPLAPGVTDAWGGVPDPCFGAIGELAPLEN